MTMRRNLRTEMNSNTGGRTDGGRFASLFAEARCPRPVYDRILFESNGCAVTPTLGSIVPGWLLVVPRMPAINFVRWKSATGVNPHDLVQGILTMLNVAAERVVWFEHGPTEQGSSIGCGVDQAHLHLIIDAPFAFRDFALAAAKAGELDWQTRSAETAHTSINPRFSYLIAASVKQAVVAEQVEGVGSQFFRRVIADLVQQPHTWNYRTHPHLDNVRRTIRAFDCQTT
jgi:ATP adenylyltransferase